MTGIAVLLAGAAVGFGLARWLALPVLPLLLCTGFLLAALGFLPDIDVLEQVLIFGVSFLLFAAGVELNAQRFGRYGRAVLRVGLVQFFALGAFGFGTAFLLGYTALTSVFLGLAVAASSTLVVVRLLQQRRQLFEPFGRVVIGVLLLQDILIILLAPVLIRLAEGLFEGVMGLLLTLPMIGIAYAFQKWILPFIVLRWKLEGESLLLTTLGVLFLFIGLTIVLDLPVITGAFLAGFSLSRFPISGLVREQFNPISDFFLSMFFIVLGGLIVVPTGRALLAGLAFIAIVVVLTPPLVTIVAERAGLTARGALESGLLLAQTSEFSLIIGLQAMAVGAIEPEIFSVIVLVTALTMITTPFLATDRNTWRLLRLHPSRALETDEERLRDHILILGCGETGMPLLETLYLAGYRVFVVDDDPVVIADLQRNGVPCLRGDGSDLNVLAAAGARDARVVISMIRRPRENRAMLRLVSDVPVLVRVFTEEDAAAIEEVGGIPIRFSHAAADAFMEWFREFEKPAPAEKS